MSNDEEYANFLDKANQDTGSNEPQQKDNKFAQTKAVDTNDVPSSLKRLDAYYSSDADEPFEPVSLKHNGKDLSISNFSKLIGHSGDVQATDIKHFNPKGKYDDVVKTVQKCSDGVHVVKVFRVEHDGTRCEYYLVTIDDEGNVVGVKVKAVES